MNIKVEWARWWQKDILAGWHILGWHVVTVVEGGSMAANSNILGYKLRWDWDRKALSNRNCPNRFRTFNGRK
ncbi:unnamed protein product, partial [marine sediment metagenome]